MGASSSTLQSSTDSHDSRNKPSIGEAARRAPNSARRALGDSTGTFNNTSYSASGASVRRHDAMPGTGTAARDRKPQSPPTAAADMAPAAMLRLAKTPVTYQSSARQPAPMAHYPSHLSKAEASASSAATSIVNRPHGQENGCIDGSAHFAPSAAYHDSIFTDQLEGVESTRRRLLFGKQLPMHM
jgi:hypothetical protein